MRKYISVVISIFIILSISHIYINSARAENVKPNPIIKVNDSDGPLSINSIDNLSITIELSPGEFAGDNADWWLVAATPFGLFYYQPTNGLWASGFTYSHQGPLFNLGEFEVLNVSGLATGSYTVYFGVDMDMNGSLDIGQAYYNSVTLTVTQDAPSPAFDVTPESRSVTSSSGSTYFDVDSTVGWSVSDNVTWLTATKTSGSRIDCTYSANTVVRIRRATITISGTGGATDSVTVIQLWPGAIQTP